MSHEEHLTFSMSNAIDRHPKAVCGNASRVAKEVIQSASTGDRESQRIIYESLIDRVYRTVFRIVGVSDAEDVSHGVFLQLFANLHKFRFESDFLTWAHRLAINQALQHLRRRKRNATVGLETRGEDPVSRSNDPDLKELFDVALSRLDAELRMILDLKESQQLPYSEIAEIVGIPEGTVGSRLNRARRELRGHLLALGWEE